MSYDLKNIYSMAKRYNKHGVVKDETLKTIESRIKAADIPEVRPMTGEEIKAVRLRWKLSQSVLARTTGMSVESVSKWERGESKPNQAVLRIINMISDKGPEIFMC